MVPASLLLLLHSQAPQFIGSSSILMPTEKSRFQVKGFTKDGGTLVHQTFLEEKFILIDKTDKTTTLSSTVDGLKCSNIHVTDRDEIHSVARTRDGRTAVFRWERGSWEKVGSLDLYYYSEAYVNSRGAVAAYGRKHASSPFSIFLQENGKLINISENLKLSGLRIHSLSDDGSMVISSDSQIIQQKNIYRFSDGRLNLLGTFSESDDLFISSVPKTEEIIFGGKLSVFSSGTSRSKLIRNGQIVDFKGPSGRPLHHVRGSSRGWYIGSEPSNSATTSSRAVIVADGQPYYLEDLLANDDELEAKYGFTGDLIEAADITDEGKVAVHGSIKLRNGNRAPAIFFLSPKL